MSHQSSQDRTSLDVPRSNVAGPYGSLGKGPGGSSPYHQLDAHDPRSSSTQSLIESLPDVDHTDKRILLVIYIHGFVGNDQSFRSFPAHVHKYLKLSLSDTHAVHSKVYPRYKTYKSIDVARDNFSRWLEPHESDRTDIILVGHSMGGLLGGDVALMVSLKCVRMSKPPS